MKKIVPFKKDILFNDEIKEIVSISLDHELDITNSSVQGKFIVSGECKYTNNEEIDKFLYTLPFIVELDEKYLLDKANVDIDDFYYEIINGNNMRVGIDVLIDNIEEQVIEKEIIEPIEIQEERCIEEEKEETLDTKSSYNDNQEKYKSYTIYIMREDDTVESIMRKYKVNREILEQYNDLSNIKIGDKVIIPS